MSVMRVSIDEIVEEARAAVGGSEEDRALAAEVVTDAVQLQARMLAGEDVTAELLHVRSQGLGLGATARHRLQQILATRVTEFVVRALAMAVGA